MEKPLTDDEYTLEKFQSNGGWTYAVIHEVKPDKSRPFGMVKVKGTIDHYAFQGMNLQPMGQGRLMLPVNATIRRKIKKEAGDTVRIILFKDDVPPQLPEELLLGLQDIPGAMECFRELKEMDQNIFINYITTAKKEETRIRRIAEVINKVLSRLA